MDISHYATAVERVDVAAGVDIVLRDGASYKGLEAKINNTRYWYEKNLDWFGQHLPQPTSGISNVTFTKTHYTAIFNLQGQRLSSEPAHGIFIKSGKKYVKR